MTRYFGKIVGGKMILNGNGRILNEEIVKTVKIRRGVEINIFQIMPDHVHMIVEIESVEIESVGVDCNRPVRNGNANMPMRNGNANMPMRNGNANMPMRNGNALSAIVRGIKGGSCRRIKSFNGRLWQRNYFEKIIRNRTAYRNIKNYILGNPQRWTGK